MIPLPDIFSAGTAAITTQSFSISVQSSCISSSSFQAGTTLLPSPFLWNNQKRLGKKLFDSLRVGDFKSMKKLKGRGGRDAGQRAGE